MRRLKAGRARAGNVDSVLALAIAPADPGSLLVTDADREALARLARAGVPAAVLGPRSSREALADSAAALGPAVRIIEIKGDVDARAFAHAARELGVVAERLYAVVDTDLGESAASLAGTIVLRLDSPEIGTLREAVGRLSAPIARSAIMLRALVADIGVES